ncbi:DUF2510 domain-containing protein [Streptomyces sp. ZYX-F-203]
MTQATPPGWYPDPGQAPDAPAAERWWDGGAWTDRIRPAAATAPEGTAPPGGEDPPVDPAEGRESGPRPGATESTGERVPISLAKPAVREPTHGDDPARSPEAAPGTVPPPAWGNPAVPPPPGTAAWQGYPTPTPEYTPRPAGRRRLWIAAAVVATAAVLTGIGVGVYALAGDGTTDREGRSAQPGPRDERGPREDRGPDGGDRAPGDSADGGVESGTVTDPLSGISLPIPEGWHGQRGPMGAFVVSDDTYACPGDESRECTKGGAHSSPRVSGGATAEEVAKADIEANAEESYGQGYGSLDSHEELVSEQVTVAGQSGYRVRWLAVTSQGSDGYVESVAFPSPAAPQRIVVVRVGVDVDQGQGVLDEIVEGIQAASGGRAGRGV